MGWSLSPLTYKEVVRALRRMGFSMKPKTATSHEQWIKKTGSDKWLVTVDKHHAPFDKTLIKSMARQAGMTTKAFHSACKLKK